MNLIAPAVVRVQPLGVAPTSRASGPGGGAGDASPARGDGVAAPRYERVDALRGLAIVWMAVFHVGFDLSYFGFIDENFYEDPFWTLQRSAIVAMFLFCAGLGQAIASAHDQPWARFWRRWAQVAGCALLVSAGSWLMFPGSFISFGVLHAVAVMLIVARLSAGAGAWLWPLGALALWLPQVWRHPFFDTRLTNWIGLVTQRPVTEDYVPLLPWLGVVWWGVASGQWLMTHWRAGLAGRLAPRVRWLAILGRWSLSFYMLHQPIIMGTLMLVVWLRR